MKRKSKNKMKVVNASELSQMGACERLVYFEAKYGKRPSHSQKEAIKRGRQEHDKFFREGTRVHPNLQTSLDKPWCFIANAIFGPAADETQTLRLFRDRVMRKSVFGRATVRMYYRISPGICNWLLGKPISTAVVRFSMKPVVMIAGILLKKRTNRTGT